MSESPALVGYHPDDRNEVFSFLREVYRPEIAARTIGQWSWKFESNPPCVDNSRDILLLRIASKLVGLVAGFRIPMWMGGIECEAECRGSWIVHPDYRGRSLWRQFNKRAFHDAPEIQIGWTQLPTRAMSRKYASNPVRPLIRILDPGSVTAHIIRVPGLGAILSTAGKLGRSLSAFRFTRESGPGSVVRLGAFDDGVDALWERARRPDRAMVIRNSRYLNWRYFQRPDARYVAYGSEWGGELGAFVITRVITYRGLRWGYLVDFLAAETSREVLRSLVAAALDDFRKEGVAGVSCYATDAAVRAALYRSGFLPAPQRNPVRFVHTIGAKRPELAKFHDLRTWYLTMGDGDFDMSL
jgi:hypothetical protein